METVAPLDPSRFSAPVRDPTEESAEAEPLADWERELLEAPVTDAAEVETIATESAADESGAEAKAEDDAAATAAAE